MKRTTIFAALIAAVFAIGLLFIESSPATAAADAPSVTVSIDAPDVSVPAISGELDIERAIQIEAAAATNRTVTFEAKVRRPVYDLRIYESRIEDVPTPPNISDIPISFRGVANNRAREKV